MPSYPTSPWSSAPSEGHRRLRLVAELLTREEGETARKIVDAHGLSRQWVYTQVAAAAAALEPAVPGPAVGWREEARLRVEVDRLRAENAALAHERDELAGRVQGMVEVSRHRRDQLELVCFAHNVSLRGTQEIAEVAWGKERRPDRDGLQLRMKERGKVALDLLSQARAQVASDLRCVMGDDVYFHRAAVKVVAEPESMAMLNVGRWEGSSGLDWLVWLEEYPKLSLLVSDLGKDLVGAATQLGIAQAADYFHEIRHFDRELLAPLSRWEERARARYWEALDRGTRPQGPGRRLSPDKVSAALKEADDRATAFYAAVEIVDRLHDVYQPTNSSTGRLWARDEIDAAIDGMIARLRNIDHSAAKRAIRHLRSHRARYAAGLVMIDLIEVELRSNARWARRTVLNGLIKLWALRRKLAQPEAWVDYSTFKDDQRLARELERRLRQECTNLDSVAEALQRELRCPKRSSSGVESLNSKLRVLQMVHRNVSDEMLGLVALAWNLTPRRHPGRRKGKSPYGMLGVDIGQAGKSWYEVLLSAQDAQIAAA
jgi:hypothetical protein